MQTGHLAMETLLSLTSKRAGDWFKEELRLLGGLDHIVDKGEPSSDAPGAREGRGGFLNLFMSPQ